VTANQTVTITASYTSGGVTKTATKTVTIMNVAPTLTGLTINGLSSVNESSSATYSATASWSNGSTSTVTPTWSENSAYASISTSGVLTTTAVTANQTVTITASYTSGVVTKTATKTVTIANVPATCTYTILPTSQSFPSSGGTGSVTVTPSSSRCAWTATESLDWVTITSGASGTGNGTVTYSVSINSSGTSRTGNITIAGQTFPISQVNSHFADVPPGYWAENFIYAIFAAGITAGCGNNNYCPENPVTRAQMAVFLERGKNGSSYLPPSAAGIFADVPLTPTPYWAAAWIEQLYNDNITSGCWANPPLYCPDNPVTRAQMAVFLLRVRHGSTYVPPTATGTMFNDVTAGTFAASWIEQLAVEGITAGCGGGNYCPDSSVTRAQMAVFLTRVFLQ